MMIISKRAFQFNDWEIEEKDGQKFAKSRNSIVVKPSVNPQFAPDWIERDELFTIALRDGNLLVVDSRSK